MKRWVLMGLAALLTMILLTACSAPAETPRPNDGAIEAGAPEATADKVDVDLSAMSSTLVYAEMFNIVSSPDEYLGKVIRVKGAYSSEFFEDTQAFYHFVVVEDATNCCAQGLEFLWNGDHAYPDDYPESGAQVTVTGVWKRYEEFGVPYYRIVTDSVLAG